MKQMPFAAAMKDYFGYKDGQNAGSFMAELRALTPADKEWFKVNLATVGYEIVS